MRFFGQWFCMTVWFCASTQAQNPDIARIQQITGLPGTLNTNENVFKVVAPRTDFKISVDGWTMPPFMGLTSWAAFTAGSNSNAVVMGDIVLFQDEVNPAMSAALDNGLSVTALHNHFFYDEPRLCFMHIAGQGDVGKLALGVRKVFDSIKETRAAKPDLTASFGGLPPASSNAITGKIIENILGVKGQAQNGMFKVVIGRSAKMSGMTVGKEMGVNTWAAFAGVDDNALVDGDFAVHEDELQDVLKILRKAGINIVAIHSHMTDEIPRTLFVHYWGKGTTTELAKALKAALDSQSR